MATTSYGVNDALAVKLWSRKLAVEALKQTWVSKFIGPDSNSLVQQKDETSKGPGDRITYGLRMQLTGSGVLGDGTLMGNEEALTTYSDNLLINQLRHAVRSAGRMSQQRVPFSVREEALSGLKDWWADRFDAAFFNQMCGFVPQASLLYTGNNAVVAPDANHYANVAASSDDTGLGSSNIFTLSMLDKAVERARTLTPAIRPIKVGSSDFFIAFLHPYQVTDLRTNTNAGQWVDIQKAAMTGGEIKDNPLFTGALGMYNNVVLHADARITQGYNPGTSVAIPTVRRAVFCGAQAAMLAFGQNNGPNRFTWVEELFDYENELGVSAGTIYGLKKTVFNSADFASIVLSSYAAQH